jgi:hypothetical protein
MTTIKPTSKSTAGRASLPAPAVEKTASPQNDRPPKAARRVAPKPFRPVAVGKGPLAPMPAVILWDEPVDPPGGGKPKN